VGAPPRYRLRAGAAIVLPLAILGLLPALAGAQTAEGPPPTPVVVPGGGTSPSPFPQVLHTPPRSAEPPKISATSAVLADLDTGQVLFSADPDAERPIASVTKIMTALLVLRRTDPTERVTVSARAAGNGRSAGISELGLQVGERVSVDDLLYALMLQSASDAAIALAEHVSGSVEAFVALMNRTAEHLGMRDTRFASPNGLDDDGYSSAADLLTLTRAADRIPGFSSITATRFHTIPAPEGESSRVVQNRNVLLWLYPGATGVKTGFTSAAGFCVVATAEREGLRLVAVVLGEPGEPFSVAAALLDYGFAAFGLRDLLARGQAMGTVEIQGRAVAVAAGAAVERALVPVDRRVRTTVVVRPGVAFPPAVGESVGVVELSVGGLRIGRVPLLVTAVPGPPPPDDPGPWWRRAFSSVTGAVGSVVHALIG
jgi:D-alanyl-D-alanine carboxypeptidase (penicillin-binding protein 5/6)